MEGCRDDKIQSVDILGNKSVMKIQKWLLCGVAEAVLLQIDAWHVRPLSTCTCTRRTQRRRVPAALQLPSFIFHIEDMSDSDILQLTTKIVGCFSVAASFLVPSSAAWCSCRRPCQLLVWASHESSVARFNAPLQRYLPAWA